MKNLRNIGLTLLVFILGINFTACSSDNDDIKTDGDGAIVNEKKIVEIIMEDGENLRTMSLSYSSKDQLISILDRNKDLSNNTETSNIVNITWGENSIQENIDGKIVTYSISEGLIRTGFNSDNFSSSFSYNSSKNLIAYTIDNGSKYTTNFTWDNSKLASIDYDDEHYTLTYSNKTCKGYFPLMSLLVNEDINVVLAHPELAGMRITQLPSKIMTMYNGLEEKNEYSYILNSEGYIQSCISKVTAGGRIYSTNFTFKWE